MGGHVAEVGQSFLVQGNALSIVYDFEVQIPPLPAANDGNVSGVGVYAVLHKLGYRLERIVLRQRDDGDGIPVVADAQLPAVSFFATLGNLCLFL